MYLIVGFIVVIIGFFLYKKTCVKKILSFKNPEDLQDVLDLKQRLIRMRIEEKK